MSKRIYGIILAFMLFVVIDRCVGMFLNKGLERYFGLNQPSQVLMTGHSHLMLATDKENMEQELGCKISKYCREGVNTIDRLQMVKQYLNSKYADSLKVVLYGVDQFMFTGEGLSENSYKLFYPFMDNPIMDQYIYKSADKLDYWQHKLITTTRYSDALLNSAIRGWMYNWSNYKLGNLDVKELKKEVTYGRQRKIHFNKNLQKAFEKTIKILTQRNIKVILVNTPIARILNNAEPESYHKMISYFKDLDKGSGQIYYLDLNVNYSKEYDLFFDAIHLNSHGQKVISKQIINYLKNIQ